LSIRLPTCGGAGYLGGGRHCMQSFQDTWRTLCSSHMRGAVSPELGDLVGEVYERITEEPSDLAKLKTAMESLLTFLGSPAGRTDANCLTTDAFFCISDHWKRRWEHLPDGFTLILDDIGGILHDTVSSPHIAMNFESTPEQLLERVRRLET
jgi:hypothetical protein